MADRSCDRCQSFWKGQCFAPQNAMPNVPVFAPYYTPNELRGHGWLVAIVFGMCGWTGLWWREKPHDIPAATFTQATFAKAGDR